MIQHSMEYFLVKTSRKNPYRSYVRIPVANQLSTYDAGRPSTMMNSDRRLTKTSERDPLVPFPSNTALTVTPTGGRAQTPVQHRPPMLKKTPSTTTSSRARKNTGNASTAATRRYASSTRSSAMRQAPSPEQLAKDHPKDPIPSKPPYPDDLTKLTLAARSSPRFGKKIERQCPPRRETHPIKPSINRPFTLRIPAATPRRTTTKTVPQRCKVDPSDIQAAEQRQRWEHLRSFHAGIRLWPADMQGIAGGSPLLETMLRPPTDTTRLPTYSWTGHGVMLPDDGSHYSVTDGSSYFSQGMWHLRNDGWVSSPATFSKQLRSTRHHPAPAKTIRRRIPAEPPICPERLTIVRNWDLMRVFYSGIHLWPSDSQNVR